MLLLRGDTGPEMGNRNGRAAELLHNVVRPGCDLKSDSLLPTESSGRDMMSPGGAGQRLLTQH